jgi:pyridoxamine 5'-phosphate oxidase
LIDIIARRARARHDRRFDRQDRTLEPVTDQSQDAIPHGDPYAIFDSWFAQAQASEPNDPNAMALATATPQGAPSVRMVLLKGHGPDLGTPEAQRRGGFVFYTNLHSRKGGELAVNPHVALLFHWKSLRRQVRIEGPVVAVTPAEADAYFASRHPESRLGSAASEQSRPLPSREVYLERVAALRAQYPEGNVPRPEHWSGYRVVPDAIEFWQDRDFRLHERRRFVADGAGGWTSTLLYP